MDSLPPSLNPGATSLTSGLEGFLGADPTLFASALGQTMAEVYNLRRPETNPAETVRDIQLDISYTDEWTDTSTLTPDADINLSYDPAWDIPPANTIIAPNLDPALKGRIVIHYNDHIQPIWERQREITINGNNALNQQGDVVSNCTGCHTSNSNTQVPAGQLELTSEVVDNGIFTKSYLELTRNDNEQWLANTLVVDRQRLCTTLDNDGNVVPLAPQTFTVSASINRASANNSNAFFDCFEIDDSPNCGAFIQDLSPPPDNCVDDDGTVSTQGSFNHYNLLTPAELRLISEWIDIGTPFFTDPFDPRLYD
jgi:hypothetical protein